MEFYKNRVLVTGGCGFIGSHYIEALSQKYPSCKILNLDICSYAVLEQTVSSLNILPNYTHEKIDIGNQNSINKIIKEFEPGLVVNFAAESHVDNSIENPNLFLETNILGCSNLMLSFSNLENDGSRVFHHISTDEVFGDLEFEDKKLFDEKSNLNPSSPYAASKASAEHIIRSYSRTFGLNYLITNCGNNFGPRQHPEKLIPKSIISFINGEKMGIYGNGKNVRDWIYVKDHVNILLMLQEANITNRNINIGFNNEKTNLEILEEILKIILKDSSCNILDYVNFINERPGHDKRYALENSLLKSLLDIEGMGNYNNQLHDTVAWYIANYKNII